MSEQAITRRGLIKRGSIATAGAAVGGQALARAPQALAARTHGNPSACAFKDVVIPLANVVIAAKVIGRGEETIVIHPSLGRGASDLDEMASRLAGRGYRVITFDPRGCGETKAPEGARQGLDLHDLAEDMLAVIDYFKLKRTHVLGHAFGNRVTRQLAVDHPRVVDTVILCAAGTGTPPVAALPDFVVATGDAAPVAEFERAVKASFFGARSNPKPWFVGWYSDGVILGRLASVATPDEDYEGGGNGPMLIVQGQQDVIAPLDRGFGLLEKYGADRITLRNIPGVGHAFPIEVPERTAEIIDRYLKRSRRRRRFTGSGPKAAQGDATSPRDAG